MKVAVIAGGSGEIGSYIAKELSYNYRIVNIHKNSNQEDLLSTYFNICSDMTDPVQIGTTAQKIYSEFDNIDLLINCIGKNISKPLEQIDLQTWRTVIETNLQSVFFLCQIIGLQMLKKNSGIIVNFTSTAGIRPLLKSPHYIAAKAGIVALTKYFAQVYAPSIRVNAIAPGYVLTKNHRPENNSCYKEIIEGIPLRRMVEMDDIVNVIKYIICAKDVTGQIFVVDGGMTL
jgi:NAD(P)-dependent dehydrogenase (short-subunit alcohol dehydrogenase family)